LEIAVNRRAAQRGVTLIEMMIVVVLIAVVAGISYPAATSGIDSLRLSSAADSVASLMLSAVNRAERRQELMEISISRSENAIAALGVNFQKRFDLPEGITIGEVLPAAPMEGNLTRRFLLYPGGAAPRVGVRLINSRGGQRLISLDPITGIPRIER
jgi:prepilin-type N-terminal cleavage/methylation domain-containing protein